MVRSYLNRRERREEREKNFREREREKKEDYHVSKVCIKNIPL